MEKLCTKKYTLHLCYKKNTPRISICDDLYVYLLSYNRKLSLEFKSYLGSVGKILMCKCDHKRMGSNSTYMPIVGITTFQEFCVDAKKWCIELLECNETNNGMCHIKSCYNIWNVD